MPAMLSCYGAGENSARVGGRRVDAPGEWLGAKGEYPLHRPYRPSRYSKHRSTSGSRERVLRRWQLQRTCALLRIPYGRGRGIVWHDTRHSAVTNLVGAGVPEVVAMSITGHVDANIFKRYKIRRDAVQVDALTKQERYLTGQRDTTEVVPTLARRPS